MLSPNQQVQVVQGCLRGERRAQEALYRAYYRPLVTCCMRYCGEHDAVEALNTGFLKIFDKMHTWNPEKGTLYTWMHRVVTNACLDALRAAKSWRPLAMVESAGDDMAGEPEVWSKMEAAELMRLIRELPPVLATVFNLYCIDGYTHKEIGEHLGFATGTSKWHLAEARKRLQAAVKKEEGMKV